MRARAVPMSLAVIALAALGVLIAPLPAAIAKHTIVLTECPPSPTPELTPPPGQPAPKPTPAPEDCVPPENDVTRGSRTLRFEVQVDDLLTNVREVTARFSSETAGVPDPGQVQLQCAHSDEDPDKPGCQSSNAPLTSDGSPHVFRSFWNSPERTPRNAAYLFHVEAIASTPTSSTSTTTAERAHLLVDNPPLVIAPPRIVVSTQTSVTLSWNKAFEPDVIAYVLYRAVTPSASRRPSNSGFVRVRTTTATTARDPVDAPGAYWYRVQVVRRSVVTPEAGISSPISGVSQQAIVASVPTPRPAGEPTETIRPSRLPPLDPKVLTAAPPPVPDAPYSVVLPYKDRPQVDRADDPSPPSPVEGEDPRGTLLPVAVGAFLVSAALALGRMPF